MFNYGFKSGVIMRLTFFENNLMKFSVIYKLLSKSSLVNIFSVAIGEEIKSSGIKISHRRLKFKFMLLNYVIKF